MNIEQALAKKETLQRQLTQVETRLTNLEEDKQVLLGILEAEGITEEDLDVHILALENECAELAASIEQDANDLEALVADAISVIEDK